MFKLSSVFGYWLAVSSIIEFTRFWVINPYLLSYGSLFPVFLASSFFSGDTFIFDIWNLYFFNNNITDFFRPCFTYISPVVDALLLVVIIAFLFVLSFAFIFMCMVTVRSCFGCTYCLCPFLALLSNIFYFLNFKFCFISDCTSLHMASYSMVFTFYFLILWLTLFAVN